MARNDKNGRLTPEERQAMRAGSNQTNAGSTANSRTENAPSYRSALRDAANALTQYDTKFPGGGRPLTAGELRQREKERQQQEDYENGIPGAKKPEKTIPESGQLGRGYNPESDTDDQDKQEDRKLKRARRKLGGFLRRRRGALIVGGSALGIVGALVTVAFTFLPWQLHHLMQNIDASTFARLQGVDVRDRSSKWLQAYMTARLLDIDGGNQSTSENVLFRADRVDNNKPLSDWYRTIRTSKFEYDVFQRYGIKFTSSFYHDGNQIKVRPAIITVNDIQVFDFDMEAQGVDGELVTRAMSGDIEAIEEIRQKGFDLSNHIETQVFSSNKEGRRELKRVMRQLLPTNGWKVWNGVKRYHIRKDIQNMTGITEWKFFETSREKWREKRISVRNKVLAKALPQNAKSGKFLRCLFGIDSCRASTDPSSPANKNLPVDGKNNNGREDGSAVGNGSGEDSLSAGATDKAAAAGDTAKEIAKKIIANGGLALGVVSFIDSLSRFDETIYDGTASKLVMVARGQQTAALYAVAQIQDSQALTGEAVGDEVREAMEMWSPSTNNESFSTLREDRPVVVRAQQEALPFTPTESRAKFCSAEHQAAAREPENRIAADKEFQFLCPSMVIGAATQAKIFEDSWNDGVGAILHPILTVWRNTVGGILDIFNAVVSAILDPIIKGIISLLGLQDNIEEVMGWLGQKALEFAGAGPMWDKFTLPGTLVNLLFQGGAYAAEGASRGQGGAKTTDEMRVETTKRYYAYLKEKNENTSFKDRYFALENPDSLAAKTLFAFLNQPRSNWGNALIGSMGNALTSPFKIISNTANAAVPSEDPYAASRMAMIETFDFPRECLDADPLAMTPASATNADEEGVFTPEQLSWDMMTNKDVWYEALYTKMYVDNIGSDIDDEKAKRIWNCALLDNSVAGGLGALYGYPGQAALGAPTKLRTYE